MRYSCTHVHQTISHVTFPTVFTTNITYYYVPFNTLPTSYTIANTYISGYMVLKAYITFHKAVYQDNYQFAEMQHMVYIWHRRHTQMTFGQTVYNYIKHVVPVEMIPVQTAQNQLHQVTLGGPTFPLTSQEHDDGCLA